MGYMSVRLAHGTLKVSDFALASFDLTCSQALTVQFALVKTNV